MSRPHVRRLVGAALIGGALISLSACAGGANSATATAAGAKSSGTAAALATFTREANAVCHGIDQKLSALPSPSSDDDLSTLLSDLQGTKNLYSEYLSQIAPLVAASPDSAELEAKWLDIEKQDFQAGEPAMDQMIQALSSNDLSQMNALESQLNAAPDHTMQFIPLLKAHGLTDCATMEADTEGSASA